jgi:hypothetical protein
MPERKPDCEVSVQIFIVGECILFAYVSNKYIDNLRSQLYSSMLYYIRISRHVSANSKPSSGVVAYRILKVSNHIKYSNGSVESVLQFFLIFFIRQHLMMAFN